MNKEGDPITQTPGAATALHDAFLQALEGDGHADGGDGAGDGGAGEDDGGIVGGENEGETAEQIAAAEEAAARRRAAQAKPADKKPAGEAEGRPGVEPGADGAKKEEPGAANQAAEALLRSLAAGGVRLKVNGGEIAVDTADRLISLAQLGAASGLKFQEAAELRRAAAADKAEADAIRRTFAPLLAQATGGQPAATAATTAAPFAIDLSKMDPEAAAIVTPIVEGLRAELARRDEAISNLTKLTQASQGQQQAQQMDALVRGAADEAKRLYPEAPAPLFMMLASSQIPDDAKPEDVRNTIVSAAHTIHQLLEAHATRRVDAAIGTKKAAPPAGGGKKAGAPAKKLDVSTPQAMQKSMRDFLQETGG